jgi:hypothetical protein
MESCETHNNKKKIQNQDIVQDLKVGTTRTVVKITVVWITTGFLQYQVNDHYEAQRQKQSANEKMQKNGEGLVI